METALVSKTAKKIEPVFTLKAPGTTELIYKEDIYEVQEIPSNESQLVVDMKQQLLGQLSLVQMFKNMENAADLFYVVYLAVDGITGLQVNVAKLRQEFIMAAGESAVSCQSLRTISDGAPIFLVEGYKLAIGGDFEKAKDAFGEVTRIAGEMMETSMELANVFEMLTQKAQTVYENIIAERAKDYDKSEELKKRIDALEAKTRGLKAAQKSLDQEIEELQEEYLNLDKRLAGAENKAFWMGIASTIASCISSGFSAYVSTTVGGAIGQASSAIAGSVQQSKAVGQETAPQPEKTADQQNLKDTEAQKETAEAGGSAEEKDSAGDRQSTEQEKQPAQETGTGKETAGASAQSTAVVNGVASSLHDASGSLNKMVDKQETVVESLTARLDSISEKKRELAKEKRSLLSQIAENTSIIASSSVTQNELDLAISALAAGIAAIQYVLNILNDFIKFWKSVQVFAKGLQTTQLTSLMSLYKNRPQELMTVRFLGPVLKNSATWVALQDLMVEYKEQYDGVYQRLNFQLQMGQMTNRQDSWGEAVRLSKNMSYLFKEQADQIEVDVKEVESRPELGEGQPATAAVGG